MLKAWLKNALKETGRSQADLARHLEVNRSAVSLMISGKRAISADEMFKAAAYLGVSPPGQDGSPALVATQEVKVVGRLATGVWRDKTSKQQASPDLHIPKNPDPVYAAMRQEAYQLDETSDDGVYRAGDYFIVVPYDQARSHPQARDLVVVARTRQDGVEMTLNRIVLEAPGRYALQPVIGAGVVVPLKMSDGSMKIVGLCVGSYRSLA